MIIVSIYLLASMTFWLVLVVASKQAPIGHEDERGFHYGSDKETVAEAFEWEARPATHRAENTQLMRA